MNSTPLGRLIDTWIAGAPERNITRLSERSGIATSLLSKYSAGRVRPTPRNLERLADALGAEYEALLRLFKYLPPHGDEVIELRVPLKDKQEAIARSYETWMAVMAPNLGEQQAAELFWKPLLSEAQRAREEAERMESAVNAALLRVVKPVVTDEIHAPNNPAITRPGEITERKAVYARAS